MKLKLKRGEKWLVLINAIGVVVASIYYISIKNFEFMWYIAVMVFFFILILTTLNRSKFDYPILIGLSIWGFMHMTGGGVIIDGAVLYKLQIIPIVGSGELLILKFDQVVHAFGFGVATLVVFHLIRPYLGDRINWKVMYPIIVLGGMGVGALNELIEYFAVVAFPETGVGGYHNTMLDSVFNTIGAIIAVILIHVRRRRVEKREQLQ